MTRNKLFRVFYIVMGLFLGYHFMMTSRSCQPNDCEYRGVRQYADGKTSLDGVRHLLEKIREETKSNSTRWKELSSGIEALDEVALQLMSLPTRTKWMKREVRPIKRSGGTFNITKSTAAVDICPEIYKGSTYGYPFFDKGFEMQPCSGVPKLQDILTLLFNFVHFDPSGDGKSKVDLDGILAQIYKLYPRIPVIIAISNTDDKFSSVKAKYTNVETIEFYTVYKMKPGAVWNTLVKKTNTKYTLIGRGLAYFDDDVRLERLIRELNSLFVDIIGGATRTPSGHWSQSCHQTVHKNYTLVYRTGYHHSKHGCILCGHLSGPFIARTSTLTKFPFNKIIKDANVVFDDFFLELKRQGRQSGACPDAMFHISEQESRKDRLQWLSTAGKWGINSVVLEDGTAMTFSCPEIRRRCGLGAFTKGRLVPPCCLEGLARMIKTVMELCEKKNIYCEFQEGTLLGAVKFGKVLPWERDGDLTFWSANFSAMWDLRKDLAKFDYTLSKNADTWCCVDNVQAGGVFMLHAPDGWHVEIYGQHRMNSERHLAAGRPPTRIFYDGQWVRVPRNPGLYVRNRYGAEVYQHAQHWIMTGKASGWDPYDTSRFTACPVPGTHDCLDQYSTDGTLQFDRPEP